MYGLWMKSFSKISRWLNNMTDELVKHLRILSNYIDTIFVTKEQAQTSLNFIKHYIEERLSSDKKVEEE